MVEIYKDIIGYDGAYQVSNFGTVKSLTRVVLKNGKYPSIMIGRTLKTSMNKGYLYVNLCKNGKRKNRQIHQLVAECFLNHIPNGFKIVVDHVDNNKLNNRLDNLQLLSNRQKTTKIKNHPDKRMVSNFNQGE